MANTEPATTEPPQDSTTRAPQDAPAGTPDETSDREHNEGPGIVRRTARTVASAAGAGLNFVALSAQIAAVTTGALRLKEQMATIQRHTEANAGEAVKVAEMVTAAEVEPQFAALIFEASSGLHRLATTSGDLSETADRAEIHARAFGDAHQAEYRGGYEVANASGVQQPKPGFNAVS